MNITLRVRRQNGPKVEGALHRYHLTEIPKDISFLEVLNILNKQLFAVGEEPIAFDSDCRGGVRGMYGVVINEVPHGLHKDRTTTCQLRMHAFKDDDTITIEPWRSKAFPVLRDLVANRKTYDRIVQTGEYTSVNTGAAPEVHSVPVPRGSADIAFETAAYTGYGACAATCPSGSAMLSTSAKVMHLGLLSQGKPENYGRVMNILNQYDAEGPGACQNIGECAKACPKQIPLDCISYFNRQLGEVFFEGK